MELVQTEVVVANKKPIEVVVSKKVTHAILNSFNLVSDNGDTLSVRVRDGRPRFVVEYNRKGVDKSKIEYLEREVTIPFDFGEFGTLVANASLVIEDKAKSLSVTSLYDIDKHGKRVEEKLKKAKITIRKNVDINAFELVVINHFLDDKESVFLLAPGSWHEFEINNNKVPNSFFSKTYTTNYFSKLDKVLEVLAKENRYTYTTSFPAPETVTLEAKQIN